MSPVPCTVCDSVTVSLTVSMSFLAVAVTVCAVLHVVPVNISVSGATPTASVSPVTLAATVTDPLGCAFRRTEYVFSWSACCGRSFSVSVVCAPVAFGSVSTTRPGGLVSVTVTATFSAARAANV